MQIVIEISDKDFEHIATYGQCDAVQIMHAITHGIPLPKGHGRLGDLDELEMRISGFINNDKDYVDEKLLARECFVLDGIKKTRSIIEADREGKDAD